MPINAQYMIRRITVKKGASYIPYTCFSSFCSSHTSLTIHHIPYTIPGGLAAAFCMAQFSSSMLWGVVSDRYGRKVAIVFGTFGAALGMLVFGSAKTYSQAIVGKL
ncbi:hypothetical protein EON64_14570 [archaeon]|nr:MAG: hypothetical protein EON64_14570 [archaeon]